MSAPLPEEAAILAPWRLSIAELGAAYRAGTLSPVDAVEACIARIGDVNPRLNAVVATRFDAARIEARDAARRLAAGEGSDQPLLGVPCTVKEFVAVEGMPNTAGLLSRRGVVGERHATVVGRLVRAGAIVLGVTNAPEGGLWHETNNPVYGRTNNPHDVRRTSGGSSGGEGAIVAAGGVPFGIGSDAGGSIRIPAGFCGIVGHKPTGGRVPSTGHFPGAPGGPFEAPMCIGPLARTVADLRTVMSVIAGPDGVDPQCRAFPGELEARDVDWSGVTVYPIPATRTVRPTREIEASVMQVAAVLGEHGATIARWTGPDLGDAFRGWAALMGELSGSYAELLWGARHRLPALARDLLRWPFGASPHTGGVLAILALERVQGVRGGAAERVLAARGLREAFDRAVGPQGLVIHPVYTRTAPRHRAIAAGNPRHLGCTALFNVTESPVTAVRAGTGADGMPIGVQIAGARGNDALTLAAAERVERALGVPSPVDPRG